jgi:hypothetical protein
MVFITRCWKNAPQGDRVVGDPQQTRFPQLLAEVPRSPAVRALAVTRCYDALVCRIGFSA